MDEGWGGLMTRVGDRGPRSEPDFRLAADNAAMEVALGEAREAFDRGEVPVGAVITREGTIIARAHNLRESRHDPTAHAECLALASAGRALGTWRLDGCTLYATLEPCPMCAGAIVQARIARVVYGASDPKAGACDSLYRIVADPRLNHRAAITRGILPGPCGEILARFFRERRPRPPAPTEP